MRVADWNFSSFDIYALMDVLADYDLQIGRNSRVIPFSGKNTAIFMIQKFLFEYLNKRFVVNHH